MSNTKLTAAQILALGKLAALRSGSLGIGTQAVGQVDVSQSTVAVLERRGLVVVGRGGRRACWMRITDAGRAAVGK